MLAEYDIHYSNEKILNCFPNYYLKHRECVFIFFKIYFLSFLLFSESKADEQFDDSFHETVNLHRLQNPLFRNGLFTYRASFFPEVLYTITTLIGINDNA